MVDFNVLNAMRCRLGEGPVWVESSGELWWMDIHRGSFHRQVWPGGPVATHKLSERSTLVVPCADGSAITSVQKGLCRVPESGPVGPPVVVIEPDTPQTSVNDGKVGPDGRLYFDSLDRAERPGLCGLYRLDDDLVARPLLTGVTLGNGLDWSPDGSVMYFVDSRRQQVYAMDFDPGAGTVASRRVLAEVDPDDGMPDGMTVDEAGNLWVALYGGARLHHYAPDGRLLDVVPTPVRYPTSCGFAGPGLATLVVTTAFAHLEDAGEPISDIDGAVLTAAAGVAGRRPVLCRTPLPLNPSKE
ncbi:SMP-30/gluconolactonase/LRE family protein [Dactylosporangium sp. CA-092794]|uniref:SMP-30/gluconolactonase/LRE family protein n=1 Tax=Dactylosporangium sp. CA-092794 TaxID=3239929 RepID=UPI003D8E030A